jgi:hypothetical protein
MRSFCCMMPKHQQVAAAVVDIRHQQLMRSMPVPLLQLLRVSVRDNLDMVPYNPPPSIQSAALIYAEINYVTDKVRQMELPASEIIDRLIKDFSNQASSHMHSPPSAVPSASWLRVA